MNIAVIGSGASAFGVLMRLKKELKENNISITVISKDLNFMNTIFSKNIASKKNNIIFNKSSNLHTNIRHNFGHTFNEIKINNSNNLIYNIRHSGGLSDIWSGSAALPLLQDLTKWGFRSDEIEPYYKTISNYLNLSGKKNEISNYKKSFNSIPNEFVNSPPIKEHDLVNKLIQKLKNKTIRNDFHINTNYVFLRDKSKCQYCEICDSCFSGCLNDSIFRPSKIINELISNKNFSYENDNVDSLKIINNEYEITTENKKKIIFDKVFLCAGALNSAKIIIKSFDYPKNDVLIYDIPTKFFPIVSKIPKFKIDKKSFGFSSASGSVIMNNDNYYHILIGHLPKEYFKNKIQNKFISSLLKNISNKLFLYGTIYGSNKDFLSYKLTKNFEITSSQKERLNQINNNLNDALKKLKKIFYEGNFLILNNFAINGKSSSHYSSNLFDAYKIKRNICAEFNKNLHICDTSILGAPSSSQPHTFFIMANAYRLADKAFQN